VSAFLPFTYAQDTTVFFVPDPIIEDYTLLPIGSTFDVKVNVSGAIDLYNAQVRFSYNTTLLDCINVVSGGFIIGPDGTMFNYRINDANGWVMASETMIGWYSGVYGDGTLFVFTFQVQGYGCSDFVFNLTYTYLQDSGLHDMPYTAFDGYFKNKLLGDSNGDKVVNVADMGVLSASWTGVPGALPYDRDVDNNDDGVINVADMGVSSANWGRTAP